MQHGPHRAAVQYALGWPRPHIEHITIARTGRNADADEEAPPDIAYASARAFFFIAHFLVPLCKRASDNDGVSQIVRLTGGRGVNATCGERATGAAGASRATGAAGASLTG